ncbi:hypothetical protein Y1Q_0022923 [Alligator mississippiensis]|uniref:Uncharacterized protein n=2 Tax=Alligator mississippiensis TaxID=8496 RepID=A0A151MI05_ALLMI|nr:hypothetical protein Y1Q_0022923 [Alligator mississippiensis]
MENFPIPFKEIVEKLHSLTVSIIGLIWYFLNGIENKVLVSREEIFQCKITIRALKKAVSELEKKKKKTEEKLEEIKREIVNASDMSEQEKPIDMLEKKNRTEKYKKYLQMLAERLKVCSAMVEYESKENLSIIWTKPLPWVQEADEEICSSQVRQNIRDQIKKLKDVLTSK